MRYRQITHDERKCIGLLKTMGLRASEIARWLGRHRSTITREIQRNKTNHDGSYRYELANQYTNGRRSRSRRNCRFTKANLKTVATCLKMEWSPEQISGRLARHGKLSISHETIYRYIWEDKHTGGNLYTYLRGSRKKRRKRYGRYDSRGRMAGKRPISTRPAIIETRRQTGHWEIDTMVGPGRPCILTIVERKTGYTLVGKLKSRTTAEVNSRLIKLFGDEQHIVWTITADNGTEFHGYADIESAIKAKFYFAKPYHSWERGTNENTNGLIRQYLPKGKSMENLTQHDCNRIAAKLNSRPRKRLGYRTPEECYVPKH